jgi:hypothetical protein
VVARSRCPTARRGRMGIVSRCVVRISRQGWQPEEDERGKHDVSPLLWCATTRTRGASNQRAGSTRHQRRAGALWPRAGSCASYADGELERSTPDHEASQTGGGHGSPWRGTGRGRGYRTRGPCPHCGHGVMSMPVTCCIHSTTVGLQRCGGSGTWPNRCRHWRRAWAWHRFARQPMGRMRMQPWGSPCRRKRRMHARASRVIGWRRSPWRRVRDLKLTPPWATWTIRWFAIAPRCVERPTSSRTCSGPAQGGVA